MIVAGKQGSISAKGMTELLQAVPLLAQCSKRELRLLAGLADVVEFEEGEIICRQGDKSLGLGIVVEGRVDVLVGSKHKRYLTQGDFYGEISLLDGRSRSATLKAVDKTRCLQIPTWGFRSAMKADANLTLKMLTQVCSRIRSSEQD